MLLFFLARNFPVRRLGTGKFCLELSGAELRYVGWNGWLFLYVKTLPYRSGSPFFRGGLFLWAEPRVKVPWNDSTKGRLRCVVIGGVTAADSCTGPRTPLAKNGVGASVRAAS